MKRGVREYRVTTRGGMDEIQSPEHFTPPCGLFNKVSSGSTKEEPRLTKLSNLTPLRSYRMDCIRYAS